MLFKPHLNWFDLVYLASLWYLVVHSWWWVLLIIPATIISTIMENWTLDND